MLLGIDHVVLASEDPDEAAASLERRLGVAAPGGGRHDTLGTFNRLVWLGDSYLELVGVFDSELARHSWFGQPVLASLERGGGLATWAIAVDHIEDTLRWGPPKGGLVGPLDGERLRPDGRVVRWRLAHPDGLSPSTPFVIEHDETAAEWTPAERAGRSDERHPFGGRARLAAIEIEVPSPPAAAGRVRTLLAATPEPVGHRAVRVRFGPHEVRFVADRPRAPATVELITDVPLRTRFLRIGRCEVRLRGAPRETEQLEPTPA
jgi:hypothetical protein